MTETVVLELTASKILDAVMASEQPVDNAIAIIGAMLALITNLKGEAVTFGLLQHFINEEAMANNERYRKNQG